MDETDPLMDMQDITIYMTSYAILDLINMYFDSSMTIIY